MPTPQASGWTACAVAAQTNFLPFTVQISCHGDRETTGRLQAVAALDVMEAQSAERAAALLPENHAERRLCDRARR